MHSIQLSCLFGLLQSVALPQISLACVTLAFFDESRPVFTMAPDWGLSDISSWSDPGVHSWSASQGSEACLPLPCIGGPMVSACPIPGDVSLDCFVLVGLPDSPMVRFLSFPL